MRSRIVMVVAVAAASLLAVPLAASAQRTGVSEQAESIVAPIAEGDDAPSDEPAPETGIGQPHEITCRGRVVATVEDLDGLVVDGAVLMVGGQRVAGAGTVELACGEATAALLVAPDGYASAGPTERVVPIRRDATTTAVFRVDPVAVLGVQLDRTEAGATPPAAAPDPAATPVLAETGPADVEALVAAALLAALLGVLLVGATPTPSRSRAG